jgi:hypothetical protein
VAVSSSGTRCRFFSNTQIAQSSVISDSKLGEFGPWRRSQEPTPARQSGDSCCSDANRIASVVASIRGRAKSGLLASSLFSKLTRRLNLRRELVWLVVVEELVDVEIVNGAVVVESHMIIVKIEGVGDSEDPVLSEVMI